MLFDIRLDPAAKASVGFADLRNGLKNLNKDSVVERLKNVSYRGDTINIDGLEIAMSDKASGELLSLIGLDKMERLLAVIQNDDERNDIRKQFVRSALIGSEGKNMRFHTVDKSGVKTVNSIGSAKFGMIDELELLDIAEEATQTYDMVPFRLSYDTDKTFLQFVRLDKRFVLPNMAYSGMDKLNGMVTIQLSEVGPSFIEAGWFQNWCKNGCILGQDTEFSVKATRTQSLGLKHFLPAMFEAILEKQDGSENKLLKMVEQPFNDRAFIEEMFENRSLTQVYRKHVEHEIDEIEEQRGNRIDVYNKITRKAHEVRTLSPFKQIGMERIAGKYLASTRG